MMTYTHDDYTVGWISALSDELTSAQALLDDEHDILAAVPGDNNAYTLGCIGSHNIVIAGLPEGVIGTNAAGYAATNLLRSFPNIRFVLMVGVGGGVPAAKVRLGDVVVSVAEGQTSGVIQYDLGTNLQVGGFIRKGYLRDAPSEVLTAVKKLRASARRQGYKMKTYYDTMLEQNPLLRPDFERPKDDNLFEPDYVHIGPKADCSQCDNSKLIKREDRETPVVHYGLIGSGNQVIRNTALRDQLHKDEGIICLEMEAAGLMRNFECLVIRGICVQEDIRQVTLDIGKLVTYAEETRKSEELQKAVQWLAASDPETNYRSALELRNSGTGSWLVECAAYEQWKLGSTRHIWLHGKAGSGKSVIAATVIEDIKVHCQNKNGIGYAMFYFTFSDARKQSYRDCLCSLIAQVATRNPASAMLLQAYQQSTRGTGSNLPPEESLEQILISAIQSYDQFFLILDALDESPETLEGNNRIRQTLLRRLCDLSSRAPNLKILSTSRHLNDISDGMDVLGAERVSMITNVVNKDIMRYVKNQLAFDPRLSRFNSSMKKKVEKVFKEKADGMFRWAYCQMRELKSLQSTKASHIERVLLDLPRTLDETYDRMIKRIQPELWHEALTLLKWLAYSRRPMTLAELSEATIIDPYVGDGIVDIDDRGSPEDVLEILSGLIIFTKPEEDRQEDNLSSISNDTGSDGDDTVFKEDTLQSRSREQQSICLAHSSVLEYLESTCILESDIKIFYLQENRGHQFLSDCCLNYLMKYASSDKITKSEQDLSIFPLLQYAAQFWYQHSRHANEISWQIRFLCSKTSVDCWDFVHKSDDFSQKPFTSRVREGREYQIGSSLYFAACAGLSSLVEVLIEEHRVDVNALGGYYGSALQVACIRGYEEIARTLVEKYNASVDIQEFSYDSPLQNACFMGHEGIVKLLIANKADLNTPGRTYNALELACIIGYEGVIKLLLENGADVNATGDNGHGALMHAINDGHERIVKLLLENGADTKDLINPDGNALYDACTLGNERIVKLLLENGADITTRSDIRQHALNLAILGGYESVVRLLIEHGALMVPQEKLRFTLFVALEHGREGIIKMLKENQAFAHWKDYFEN